MVIDVTNLLVGFGFGFGLCMFIWYKIIERHGLMDELTNRVKVKDDGN